MRSFNTSLWLRRLRGATLVLVFISVFLYIFSLNFRTPGQMDLLQRSVTETVNPPIRLFGRVISSFEEFFQDYIWLRNLRVENESLKNELTGLHDKLTSYQEAYVENQRLRRLLDFRTSTMSETIPAQVIVHDLTGWFQTIMVDKGFRDGVAPDMPVVNDEGVIGRVLDVSDHHSRVLLITDQGSAVDAIVQRNRVRGILRGKDANGCILKYIRGNLDIKEGDLVITSGKDGIFPKGLRLGVVHTIRRDPADLFQNIDVKPLCRLSALEEVLIIKRAGPGLGAGDDEVEQSVSAQPEVQSQAQGRTSTSATPVAVPATKSAKPRAKPLAQTQSKPQPKPPVQVTSKAKPTSKPQLKPQTQANRKPGSKGQTGLRNRPGEKAQPDPRGQALPKPKVDSR
ncbi:Cell shape-determining protein MreC (modular protein) [Syntrophobacter sp. SbD1]|nr:Cell shape-determining protein MreC (modular protein) [Syntrophobacter sp. SbD1]